MFKFNPMLYPIGVTEEELLDKQIYDKKKELAILQEKKNSLTSSKISNSINTSENNGDNTDKKIFIAVCNIIKKTREAKKITHEQLAADVGVSTVNEYKIEKGRNIRITTAMKIARALRIDMNTLCNIYLGGVPFFPINEETKD